MEHVYCYERSRYRLIPDTVIFGAMMDSGIR